MAPYPTGQTFSFGLSLSISALHASGVQPTHSGHDSFGEEGVPKPTPNPMASAISRLPQTAAHISTRLEVTRWVRFPGIRPLCSSPTPSALDARWSSSGMSSSTVSSSESRPGLAISKCVQGFGDCFWEDGLRGRWKGRAKGGVGWGGPADSRSRAETGSASCQQTPQPAARLRCPTLEWLASICSTAVAPERGTPTTNIGVRSGDPPRAKLPRKKCISACSRSISPSML
mmetsp:Transcript_13477/g.33963  ORF Transcript_13477/g.33963 Transcript_13477/m.33963 type:complete len:230 (-) Transcript_13477:630-1319(-)